MSTESEAQVSKQANLKKNVKMETTKLNETTFVVDDKKETKPQWTKLLAFAGYATTFGSAVPGGYCTGVVNSPAIHIRHWCNETLIYRYDLQLSDNNIDILWSAIVSMFLVGGAIGSLGGAWTANKFGRRGALFASGLLFFAGGILFYICRLCSSVEMLIIGRLLVGIASGLTMVSMSMYLCEMAPLALRGTLAVFCPMGFTGGVVVGQVCSLRYVFGTAEHWHLALSFYAILVVLCYGPACFFPESPKWLYVVKGDKALARQQLKRLRGNVEMDTISREIDEMEIEANLKGQASSFGAVLLDRKYLLPLIIVCAYMGGNQMSGINAIFYYSVSIFRKAGLSAEAAEWANLAAGSLNLFVSLLGPILMARINRRPLMLFSCFFCSFFLLSFALLLHFIDSVSWFANGCIACIFLFIFFFQFGVGPIPFFIGSEIFEVAPRSVAMSIGSLSSWGCNFIVGMTFPSLQNLWGSLVFLPFSASCALLFFLTKFYLPETKGRDPSEIAPLVANGFKSKVL